MIDAVLAIEERRVILVDGFNVLHAVLQKAEREAGWWRRKPREQLLRRIAGWREGVDEIWVAFDGAQPAWSVWAEPVVEIVEPPDAGETWDGSAPVSLGGQKRSVVHSVFVESADDWIVRRARRARRPERTFIVTADRQVAGRARSAGCEVWTPWSFMSRCPSGDKQGLGTLPDTASTGREDPPTATG